MASRLGGVWDPIDGESGQIVVYVTAGAIFNRAGPEFGPAGAQGVDPTETPPTNDPCGPISLGPWRTPDRGPRRAGKARGRSA